MKWLFGMLLLASLAFFGYMQLSKSGAGDNKSLQAKSPLYAEKIILLPQIAASAVASVLAESAVQPASAETVAASALAPAAKREQPLCLEWGSFNDKDYLRARSSLTALKLNHNLIQRQTEHINGYWVYIPPLINKIVVNQKIAELHLIGVDDYFVVREAGKWHHAISLGVFHTKEAADNFRKGIIAKGVKSVNVGERKSKRSVTAFLWKAPSRALRDKISGLQKDFPSSALKTITCHLTSSR